MENKIYSKVFMWLFIGLLVTFGIGYGLQFLLYQNANFAKMIFSGAGFWIIIIAELVIAVLLSARISKMNSTTAKILYILYSAITGITFSAIFMMFELSSIIMIFLICGILFGVFAVIGSKLNIDFRKFGTYLFIALIGVIIVEIINIFIGNSTLNMLISGLSILLFTLYIGYDIKVIESLSESGIDEDKIAVYGAFQLYLDFINIFIRLLELFGKSKD